MGANDEVFTVSDTLDICPFPVDVHSAVAPDNVSSLPVGGDVIRARLAADFFEGKSITELAREQNVGPIKDIRVLAGGIPENADVDELLAQLEELRGS